MYRLHASSLSSSRIWHIIPFWAPVLGPSAWHIGGTQSVFRWMKENRPFGWCDRTLTGASQTLMCMWISWGSCQDADSLRVSRSGVEPESVSALLCKFPVRARAAAPGTTLWVGRTDRAVIIFYMATIIPTGILNFRVKFWFQKR